MEIEPGLAQPDIRPHRPTRSTRPSDIRRPIPIPHFPKQNPLTWFGNNKHILTLYGTDNYSAKSPPTPMKGNARGRNITNVNGLERIIVLSCYIPVVPRQRYREARYEAGIPFPLSPLPDRHLFASRFSKTPAVTLPSRSGHGTARNAIETEGDRVDYIQYTRDCVVPLGCSNGIKCRNVARLTGGDGYTSL